MGGASVTVPDRVVSGRRAALENVPPLTRVLEERTAQEVTLSQRIVTQEEPVQSTSEESMEKPGTSVANLPLNRTRQLAFVQNIKYKVLPVFSDLFISCSEYMHDKFAESLLYYRIAPVPEHMY